MGRGFSEIEKARQDVEPWSRMAGGMARDALDEAGVKLRPTQGFGEMPFDEKLRRPHKLHQDGIISEEDHRREKKEILDRN